MPRSTVADLTEREWWIGLSGWVLQDGNYTDFAVGDVRQFALEFGYLRHERLRSTNATAVSCAASDDDAGYRVSAEVIRAVSEPMQDCFILDFGLRAYSEWMVLDDLEPPMQGAHLEGEIDLHVDHFAYMDELAKRSGMPPLIYTWRIDEIRVDTSPVIKIDPSHPLYVEPDEGPMHIRDPDRRSWRNADRTDMFTDEGSYTLRCTLLDPVPTNSMKRSGKRSPYGPITP